MLSERYLSACVIIVVIPKAESRLSAFLALAEHVIASRKKLVVEDEWRFSVATAFATHQRTLRLSSFRSQSR